MHTTQKLTRILALLLGLLLLLSLAACTPEEPPVTPPAGEDAPLDPIWDTATYKHDSILGNGGKAVLVDVEAKGHTISIMLQTNEETLGQALYELKLINDPSYFDTLNGMKADWNADQAYWAFYQGDSYMSVGVNETVIEGGEHYRFVYTQ